MLIPPRIVLRLLIPNLNSIPIPTLMANFTLTLRFAETVTLIITRDPDVKSVTLTLTLTLTLIATRDPDT